MAAFCIKMLTVTVLIADWSIAAPNIKPHCVFQLELAVQLQNSCSVCVCVL